MSSHRLFGRQLSRDSEHRMAMRRNLVQSLFEHGKVRTTLPKAQEVKAMAEKLITLARTGTLNSRRRVISILQDRRLTDKEQEFTGKTVVQKLFEEIAPNFAGRPGGYTRIIKLSDFRIGDGGSLVLLQLLTEQAAPRGTIRRSAGRRRKRAERRHQFASQALKKAKSEASPAPAEEKPAEAEPSPAE
ncbi:MAG: 50S ribosomal protein L17 [Tepidisphaeraceae bacterium]